VRLGARPEAAVCLDCLHKLPLLGPLLRRINRRSPF
jgi:hypothetical protein